jgi:hypothetical protein
MDATVNVKVNPTWVSLHYIKFLLLHFDFNNTHSSFKCAPKLFNIQLFDATPVLLDRRIIDIILIPPSRCAYLNNLSSCTLHSRKFLIESSLKREEVSVSCLQ